jgi:hypothetical protein
VSASVFECVCVCVCVCGMKKWVFGKNIEIVGRMCALVKQRDNYKDRGALLGKKGGREREREMERM